LRAADLDADAYASATDFLGAVRGNVPDCLVLDAQMPGMSGLELQQKLNDIGMSLPVVMITGHDDASMHAMCMAAGASTYLYKPLDDDRLLRAIDQAISDAPRNRRSAGN
jgi:FixJ family two-component response regulator